MKNLRTKSAEAKIPKIPWASQGNSSITIDTAQTIALCQELEEKGYGLRQGFPDRVDSSLAVVLPDNRVVELSELEDFAMKNKDPLKTKNKDYYVLWDAYKYVQAYRTC